MHRASSGEGTARRPPIPRRTPKRRALPALPALPALLALLPLPAALPPVGCNRPKAPTITQQPADRVAAPGHVAVFHVAAAGSPPFRYDWRRNGVSLGAPSLDTYVTPNLAADDDGAVFVVVVSNAAGATVSHTVRLQVRRVDGR